MTWTARLVIPLLIVAIQTSRCYGQVNNQRHSAELGHKFISLFLGTASMQSSFTIDQLEDMASIGHTIVSSIEELKNSGKNFKNRIQALKIALASAIAEIAVEDKGGASLDVKTNAIEKSLISAHLQTFGALNQKIIKFINDVKSLINMFSEANANGVIYSGSPTSASSVGVAGIYGKSAGTGNIANYAKYESAASSSTPDGAVQTEEADGYRIYGQGAGSATITDEGTLEGGQHGYDLGSVIGAGTGATALKISAGGYGGYERGSDSAFEGGSGARRQGEYNTGTGASASVVAKDQKAYRPGTLANAGTGGGASKGGAGGYGGYAAEVGTVSSAGVRPGGIVEYALGSKADAFAGVGGGAAGTASKTGEYGRRPGFEIGAVTGIGGTGGYDTNSGEGAAASGGKQAYYDIGSKTSTAGFGSQEVYGLAPGVGSGARVSAEGGTVVYEEGNSKGENEVAGTSISNTVMNTVSRLSSFSSNQRVSSAAYLLLSSGQLDISSLTNVISNLSSSIIASNPGLSGCEVLVQVLIEVTSALVHIISSSSISQVNLSVEDGSAIMVGQSLVSALV